MQVLPINKKNINKAIEVLQKGGTVVHPTETSYGLGCDWQNKRAIAKIFKIKKRPRDKRVAVICAHKAMVEKFFVVNQAARKLAVQFWPGALGIILESRIKNQELGGTAVRVSSNDVARALSRGIKSPLVSTSANISGKGDPYDIKTIIKSFEKEKNQPDLILAAGRLPLKKPSTIVRVEDGVEVIRQGEIKL